MTAGVLPVVDLPLPNDSVDGAGWETLFVAIDDHARIAFTAMHPDEKKDEAVRFLRAAVRYYATLGITVKRLLTDNGSAFRSFEYCAACKEPLDAL